MPPKNDKNSDSEETTEGNNATTGPQPPTNGEAPSSTQLPTKQATMEQKFKEKIDEMFDVMKHSFMFKYTLSHICVYTGSNILLENFVKDVRKEKACVHKDIIPAYVTALIFKLKGRTRD